MCLLERCFTKFFALFAALTTEIRMSSSSSSEDDEPLATFVRVSSPNINGHHSGTTKDDENNVPTSGKQMTVNNDSDGGSTSDTSIEDAVLKKDVDGSPKKDSTVRKKTSKEKSNSPGNEKKVKEKEDPLVKKMKGYIRATGLRCVYKQMFDESDDSKLKIAKLRNFLTEHGLSAPFSLSACKHFRERKEREKELAELDTSNIIDVDVPKNGTRLLRSERRKRRCVVEESSSSSDESGTDEEEMKRQCREALQPLDDIIDDGQSGSE